MQLICLLTLAAQCSREITGVRFQSERTAVPVSHLATPRAACHCHLVWQPNKQKRYFASGTFNKQLELLTYVLLLLVFYCCYLHFSCWITQNEQCIKKHIQTHYTNGYIVHMISSMIAIVFYQYYLGITTKQNIYITIWLSRKGQVHRTKL